MVYEKVDKIITDNDVSLCSSSDSNISSETINEYEAAKDKIVTLLFDQIDVKEGYLEDIEKALEDIKESNDQLEEAGKPTIPPPDLDGEATTESSDDMDDAGYGYGPRERNYTATPFPAANVSTHLT